MACNLKFVEFSHNSGKNGDPGGRMKTVLHVFQRPLIERLYEKNGCNHSTFAQTVLHPASRAFRCFPLGEITGHMLGLDGNESPVLSGPAPILALAIMLQGLDEKHRKSEIIAPSLMPYAERALSLVSLYNGDAGYKGGVKGGFLSLVTDMERSCEYVPTDINYHYYLKFEPLVARLASIGAGEETIKLLFAMHTLRQVALFESLGQTRLEQREQRSREEIAIPLMHVYGPMMETLGYPVAATHAYESFEALEPYLCHIIAAERSALRSMPQSFQLLSEIIAAMSLYLDQDIMLSGRMKCDHSVYSKILARKAVQHAREENPDFDSLEPEKKKSFTAFFLRQLSQLSRPQRAHILVDSMEHEVSDLFGFKAVLSNPKTTAADCIAFAQSMRDWGAFGKLWERNYIENPNSRRYIAYHLGMVVEDSRLSKLYELLNSCSQMPGFAQFEKLSKSLSAGLGKFKEDAGALVGTRFELQAVTSEMDENNNKGDLAHGYYKGRLEEWLKNFISTRIEGYKSSEPILDELAVRIKIGSKPALAFTLVDIHEFDSLSPTIQHELEKQGYNLLGSLSDLKGGIEKQAAGPMRSAALEISLREIGAGSNTVEAYSVKVVPKKR